MSVCFNKWRTVNWIPFRYTVVFFHTQVCRKTQIQKVDNMCDIYIEYTTHGFSVISRSLLGEVFSLSIDTEITLSHCLVPGSHTVYIRHTTRTVSSHPTSTHRRMISSALAADLVAPRLQEMLI